ADALAQDVTPHRLSVCVAADGCTDGTAAAVRAVKDPRVRLVEFADHGGKIAALNRALLGIGGDVVAFSDANSHFVPGALAALLAPFGDPKVGGVCGAPRVAVARSGWLGLAEQLYWAYDNALKRGEDALGGAVSAQGSLYAMRRGLIGPIPLSVADDFYISTAAPAAGLRLAFAPGAVAVEEVSGATKREFGRRVRSTERGWRGLLMRGALLNPFRHGAYAIQLLFHKFLRRLVPLMLTALLPLSALLAGQHWIYATAFAGQVALYAAALGAALLPALRRLPGVPVAFFLVGAQVAMAMGLGRVALGLHSRSWKPVR
ncbi:MAG: glycosyltransferase, partial [Alphaproteobacteria bacterium]|nr:glycosyltransferase [Alphaproteobacteria bacterium]